MKPRLFRAHGVWVCSAGNIFTSGVGYTPLQAYDDWLARELKA